MGAATRTDLSGKTFVVKHPDDPTQTAEYVVEGYWDEITGGSWMFAQGNPAALKYAMRSGFQGLPVDNDVLYGKVGAFGHLFHVSELTEEVKNDG